MIRILRSFVRDERGEDLIEYGLLAAFVAVIGVIVLYQLGLEGALKKAFQDTVTELNKRPS